MASVNELLEFGIIVIDKPTGPTSFSVSEYVREILKIRKTSHFGTLDPAVTGVLPVALNRACRLSGFFLKGDKTYVGIMRLHEDVPQEKLEKAVNKHLGAIKQLPPVRSRVKREERIRVIKEFEMLEREGKDVLFITKVQAGTYIRKLIHDIGLDIGGANMLELRRTQASIFSEKEIISLYDLEKAVRAFEKGNEFLLRDMIIPAEEAIKRLLPCIQVKRNISQILTGKPLMKKDVDKIPDAEYFALFNGETFW